MTFRTLSRLSGLTPGFPLITNETVERETLAAAATTRIVGALCDPTLVSLLKMFSLLLGPKLSKAINL